MSRTLIPRKARARLAIVGFSALAIVLAGGLEAQTHDDDADETPPVIAVTAPADPFINDASPEIILTYSDDDSGVDLATLSVRLDEIDLTPLCITGFSGAVCPSPELSEGSHTVFASVSDVAGNLGSVTLTFAVDLTAPDLAITIAGAVPNSMIFADGFESGDTGAWAAGRPPDLLINDATPEIVVTYPDALSGADLATISIEVDGVSLLADCHVEPESATCQTPELAEGEHTVVARVTDLAGNSSGYTVTVTVDLTPPVIIATVDPPAGASGWHQTAVTVTFECSDALSGVVICPGPVVLSSEGAGQEVVGTAFDLAGNSASATVLLNVDLTPPVIIATADPPANAAGWHQAVPVTVTFECSDAVSGVASCPAPVTVGGEGAGQEVMGTAFDVAGNSATLSSNVSVDLTPPVITATVDPPANAAGWHQAPVTVTFECSDALSGVASCPAPVILSGEGAGQEASGTVFDLAGNSATSSTIVNLDQTPPTFDPAEFRPLPCPELTIDMQGQVRACFADALAGVADTTVQLLVDGVDQTASAVLADGCIAWDPPLALAPGEHLAEILAGDLAGNSDSAGWCFATASPDLEIAITSPADFFITNVPAVDVSGTVSELADTVAVGGIPASINSGTFQALGVPLAEGENVIEAIAGNGFGGLGSASIAVGLDTVAPVITAVFDPPAGAAGWHGSPVTVSFDCSDALSGVADCTAPVTLSAEGAGQTVLGTAIDIAGNSATTTAGVNLDLTPPEITATIDPPANAAGWHGSPVTVSFACSDALSGVASCSAPIVLNADGAGQEVTGTVVDVAGNTASVAVPLVGIDLTPPEITASVDPPAGAEGWHRSEVTVTFDCSDPLSGLASCPAPVIVSAEGADQEVSGTAFDVAGGSAETTVMVSLDRTAPTFDPAELEPAPCPLVTVDLRARLRACFDDALAGVDEGSVSLAVDGSDRTADATIADGCIAWDTPDSFFAGEHAAQIMAEDRAGNSATREWCFEVDAPALAITIDTPAAGLLTQAATIDVSGSAAVAATSVTVNGVDATVTGGAYEALAVPLREGRNVITAIAAGADGAGGSASRVVVRDTTAPVVSIETPRAGAVVTSLQVDVAGLVNDVITGTTIQADDCQVWINGVEAVVANRSFVVSDLLLTRGPNTLLAEARDRAGNVSSSSIEVTVEDRAGQRIVLLAGNGQSAGIFEQAADTLIVRLENADGDPVPGRPVTFTVVRGDGTLHAFPLTGSSLTVDSDDFGHATASFELGGRAGAGNHRVRATAAGFLGEVEFCATATGGPPVRVTTVSGDHQRAAVDRQLPAPLVVLVTDAGGNPVGGVDVTFEVRAGGGTLDDGTPGGTPLVIEATDLDGLAEVVWTLGPDDGTDGNAVVASFAGLLESPASFSASGERPGDPGETSVSGVLLDNQDQPIPGITLHLELPDAPLDPPRSAIADSQGRFVITGAPVGSLRLIADGSTATRPGNWPTLEVDLTTIAGRDHVLAQPIWIPALADNEVLIADGGPAADVTLLMPEVPGAELTIFAHSVACPHGEPECTVSWTQVRGERVPMAPPLGSNFMLAGTFQPAGAHYHPPAQLCIPNAGEAAGAQVEIFSFDHDLGDFVAVGMATVSDDGSQICSDPGFGLIKGGWHGCAPPPPPCSSSCNDCPPAADECQTITRDDQGCAGCSCEVENEPDGTGCDDMDECTVMDACAGGSCDGEPLMIETLVATAGGEEEELAVAFEDPSSVDFTAEATDNGCAELSYEWDFGDGETSTEQNPSHDYAMEGEYPVTVTATCDSDCDQLEETLTVFVVKADLVIQELPEEDQPPPHEEDPGAFMMLNDDDDNDNGRPDLEDVPPGGATGSVTGEDDLLPVLLGRIPDTVTKGLLTLEVLAGGAKIEVWEQPTKGRRIELPRIWDLEAEIVPDMVYVEGVEVSDVSRDVELQLTYTGQDSSTHDDRAKLTVVDLELTLYKPPVLDPAEPEIADEDELDVGGQTFVNLDNDDQDAAFDTGSSDTDVAGEDEMMRLDLELRPGDLSMGSARLEAALGGADVRVWQAADKGNMEYVLATDLAVPGDFAAGGGALTKQLWVEGVAAHTAQRGTELRLTYSGAPAEAEDRVALTFLGIDRIEWRGQDNSRNDDNTLDADPNHPAGLVPPAVRVFPGARLEGFFFPEPGAVRNLVDVVVTLSARPIEPVDLFFQSFDVDDPTASVGAVDNETSAEDNRGTVPARAGRIVGADGGGVHTQSFEGREASFEFQITMQPGDNFRIVGNGDRDFIADLSNDDSLGAGTTNNADKQRIVDLNIFGGSIAQEIREPGSYASDTLSVWRFVHIEVDSMGEATSNDSGRMTDFLGTGTALTELQSTINLDDGSANLDDTMPGNGRFENGRLEIGSGPGAVVVDPIIGNGDARLVLPPTSIAGIGFTAYDNDIVLPESMTGTITEVTRNAGGTSFVWTLNLTGSPPADWNDFVGGELSVGEGEMVPITMVNEAASQITTSAIRIRFFLRDDDAMGDVAAPDLSLIAPAFAPAYVIPLYDIGDDNDDVPFVLNVIPPDSPDVYDFDAIAWEADPDFWTIYLLGAFQPNVVPDFDPNSEGTTLGIVDAINGIGGKVFKEGLRELGASPVANDAATTAHEVGHLFNGLHGDFDLGGDAGLMAQTTLRTVLDFTDVSLNKIRSVASP